MSIFQVFKRTHHVSSVNVWITCRPSLLTGPLVDSTLQNPSVSELRYYKFCALLYTITHFYAAKLNGIELLLQTQKLEVGS